MKNYPHYHLTRPHQHHTPIVPKKEEPAMQPLKTKERLIIASGLLAVVLLMSACASKEEKIDAIALEAENALFEGDQDKALSILAKGVKKFDQNSPLFEAYANALAEAGRWEEAADAINTAIGIDPVRKSLWVNLGEFRSEAGDLTGAIDAFTQYVAFDSEDFLVWKNIYQLKARANDLSGAIDAALTWNRLRPSARPALALGDLFLASGNSAQARSWYAQAAAYTSEEQAKTALSHLIAVESDTKQYLQAEIRIKEYESRYGPGDRDSQVAKAKQLVSRWRTAQEEMARAGQALLAQREDLKKENQKTVSTPPAESAPKPEPENAQPQVEETTVAEVKEEPQAPAPGEEQKATEKPADIAPTPLYSAAAPTKPTAPANQPIGSTETKPLPAPDNATIDQLWDMIGQNPDNVGAWYNLASLFSEQQNWFDAEACILQAKQRRAQSEEIAVLYISIIAHTQPSKQVIQEANAYTTQFSASAPIALARAKALQSIKANRFTIRQAYRDVLALAAPNSPEQKAATQYLNTRF